MTSRSEIDMSTKDAMSGIQSPSSRFNGSSNGNGLSNDGSTSIGLEKRLMNVMGPLDFNMGPIRCSAHTITQLLNEVRILLQNRDIFSRTILCLNAHIFNLAWSDASLRKNLWNARIVTSDGVSIRWSAPLFGVKVPERCNMTEAFRAFLQAEDMPSTKVALIGMTEEEARTAARRMENMSNHCRFVNIVSGYLDEARYREIFKALRDIDIILIGMGTPRTERICAIASAECPEAIIWGIGGGTIRIFSGTMKEAPAFMRRIGFQWLHRLVQEPRRLFKRYLIGNLLFVLRVIRTAIRKKRGYSESFCHSLDVESLRSGVENFNLDPIQPEIAPLWQSSQVVGERKAQ